MRLDILHNIPYQYYYEYGIPDDQTPFQPAPLLLPYELLLFDGRSALALCATRNPGRLADDDQISRARWFARSRRMSRRGASCASAPPERAAYSSPANDVCSKTARTDAIASGSGMLRTTSRTEKPHCAHRRYR